MSRGATGVAEDVAAIFGARSHYAILGLAPEASAPEIRHAYRQVSLRVHPDKVLNGHPELVKDAEAAFKLVAAAYAALSDEAQRAAHDAAIGLRRGRKARVEKQEEKEKEEPWVYKAPQRQAETPEAREHITITVRHAIFGHEVRLVVGKGADGAHVKRTLSKMVKRGPPDRIELATSEGVPLGNDHAFECSAELFSAGLGLGPPRLVKVAVTDSRTGVCKTLSMPDTSSLLHAAREVAKVAGVAADAVEMGTFSMTQEGLTVFNRLDERELLNGRRSLVAQGKSPGAWLLSLTVEEAAAIQDDLIAVYSQESVQQKLDMLLMRQRTSEALNVTDFHKAYGEIVAEARQPVCSKWGFEGEEAFLQMCRGIHRYEGTELVTPRSMEIGRLLRGFSREGAFYSRDGKDTVPPSAVLQTGWEALWSSDAIKSLSAEAPAAAPAEEENDPAALEEEPEEASSLATAKPTQPEGRQIWKVVGGQDRGGLLVREGLELESLTCAERLSTGAFVRELQLLTVEGAGERLHFERLTGTGPEYGWISIALPHKNLAERVWITQAEAQELARKSQSPAGQQRPWHA